mgnify:CR=1 FL=1
MLQANELVIGDWVLDGNAYAQVTSITCDGEIETTHNEHSNIEFIKPIPLMPETLERMGFSVEEDPIYEYYEDEDDIEHTYTAKMKCVDVRKCNVEIKYRTTYGNEIFVFSSDHHNRLPSRRIDTQIEYVHELQHIFRIMQINKEIVF